MKFLVPLMLLMLSSFAEEERKAPVPEVLPTRQVSIIVTKEGYYPKSISVFEGEKIKFFVTATVEDPSCVIVEAHKVFLAANKGKLTEGEAVFNKAGEYSFYCPGSKNDGKVVVIKKVVQKREVASENKESMIWTPKEY